MMRALRPPPESRSLALTYSQDVGSGGAVETGDDDAVAGRLGRDVNEEAVEIAAGVVVVGQLLAGCVFEAQERVKLAGADAVQSDGVAFAGGQVDLVDLARR